MSTTSIKLPDELKRRAATAAQKQGMSTHAFLIKAIEYAAQAVETRAEFIDEAKAARSRLQDSGKGYDADDVHAYIQERVSGKNTGRPKAKSWRE